MDKNCKICGFFVDNPTTTAGNAGYCLFYDEKGNAGEMTGESTKIPDGEERAIAATCKTYFRKVPALTKGDFLTWRIGAATFKIQQKLDKRIQILTGLAVIIAALQICIAIIK